MNTPNNKRKKDSQLKIEKAFIELIQTKEINEITITDICKKTNLNRSTFYANYIDIYDLVDKIKDKMITDFFEIYKDEVTSKQHSYDFLKLFKHIKENQLFYKTYFKLNIDLSPAIEFIEQKEVERFFEKVENTDYHVTFFKAGLNAVLKKWLNNNCDLSPEEINQIIVTEYSGRQIPEE